MKELGLGVCASEDCLLAVSDDPCYTAPRGGAAVRDRFAELGARLYCCQTRGWKGRPTVLPCAKLGTMMLRLL